MLAEEQNLMVCVSPRRPDRTDPTLTESQPFNQCKVGAPCFPNQADSEDL